MVNSVLMASHGEAIPKTAWPRGANGSTCAPPAFVVCACFGFEELKFDVVCVGGCMRGRERVQPENMHMDIYDI